VSFKRPLMVQREELTSTAVMFRVADIEALEPKKEVNGDADAVDGDGDISMDPATSARAISPTTSGLPNGTNTERDELEDSPQPEDDTISSAPASRRRSGRVDVDDGPGSGLATASRQKALKEKAAEKEATTTMKALQLAQEKQNKAESKHITAERKRLQDEEVVLKAKLHQLEYDFRSLFYALRARPLGWDRFGNRVWWMDGIGSSSLDKLPVSGWGTGRIYVQGGEEGELEWLRIAAEGLGFGEVTFEHVESRREVEEGGDKLGVNEWGVYDTPEDVSLVFHSPWSTR
jgi:bromodomain adjacent to zinc finger domain protein 1A